MSRNQNSTAPTRCWRRLTSLACALAALPMPAQYPGRVDPSQSKPQPVLRATAVLEYTGELSKPLASRLVPLAVWDGERYQPGGLYLAQPVPLAVETGTQYELYVAGLSKGLYDVKAAANIGGSWIAIGNFQKPAPPAVSKLKKSKTLPLIDGVNYDDGKPHFAHRPAQATPSTDSKGSSPGSGSGSSGSSSQPNASSDRPVLHRRDSGASDSSGSTDSAGSASTPSTTSTSTAAPPVDPDRPTLHRPNDSNSSASSGPQTSGSQTTASSAPATDPDRPKLHHGRSNPDDNGAPVSATMDIDPDRPRLRHGRPLEYEKLDLPANVEIDKVEKAAQDVELIAAVSDARLRAPHPYTYSWSSPEDQQKAQAALEEQARVLLGGAPAPKPTPASAKKTAAQRAHAKAAAAPQKLPILQQEVFKAYELSFGGGATLVFTASSGEGDATKYVTLIAQPAFDGTPQVMFKQVTSAMQLDIVPRMEIVDAVDTDADNRAELIFALAGITDRQYAIYRIAEHSVEEVFNTGGS